MQEQLKENTTKERILEQATELFMRLGVRSVTMDDIARELGISKKTIYQHFENKAEMVVSVSSTYCQKNEAETLAIASEATNAIEELVKVMESVVRTFQNMAPNLIFEMQRYYPEAWQQFQHHEKSFILGKVRENLERGIREGLYRPELDVEIVSRLRVAQIETAFNPSIFPSRRFAPLRVQQQLLDFYMHGISTPRGKELIEKYLKDRNWYYDRQTDNPNPS